MVNYSRYVKQVHLPARSAKKEREMLNLMSGLKHPVRLAIKINPGAPVDSEQPQAFFNMRGSRSAGHMRGIDNKATKQNNLP